MNENEILLIKLEKSIERENEWKEKLALLNIQMKRERKENAEKLKKHNKVVETFKEEQAYQQKRHRRQSSLGSQGQILEIQSPAINLDAFPNFKGESFVDQNGQIEFNNNLRQSLIDQNN